MKKSLVLLTLIFTFFTITTIPRVSHADDFDDLCTALATQVLLKYVYVPTDEVPNPTIPATTLNLYTNLAKIMLTKFLQTAAQTPGEYPADADTLTQLVIRDHKLFEKAAKTYRFWKWNFLRFGRDYPREYNRVGLQGIFSKLAEEFTDKDAKFLGEKGVRTFKINRLSTDQRAIIVLSYNNETEGNGITVNAAIDTPEMRKAFTDLTTPKTAKGKDKASAPTTATPPSSVPAQTTPTVPAAAAIDNEAPGKHKIRSLKGQVYFIKSLISDAKAISGIDTAIATASESISRELIFLGNNYGIKGLEALRSFSYFITKLKMDDLVKQAFTAVVEGKWQTRLFTAGSAIPKRSLEDQVTLIYDFSRRLSANYNTQSQAEHTRDDSNFRNELISLGTNYGKEGLIKLIEFCFGSHWESAPEYDDEIPKAIGILVQRGDWRFNGSEATSFIGAQAPRDSNPKTAELAEAASEPADVAANQESLPRTDIATAINSLQAKANLKFLVEKLESTVDGSMKAKDFSSWLDNVLGFEGTDKLANLNALITETISGLTTTKVDSEVLGLVGRLNRALNSDTSVNFVSHNKSGPGVFRKLYDLGIFDAVDSLDEIITVLDPKVLVPHLEVANSTGIGKMNDSFDISGILTREFNEENGDTVASVYPTDDTEIGVWHLKPGTKAIDLEVLSKIFSIQGLSSSEFRQIFDFSIVTMNLSEVPGTLTYYVLVEDVLVSVGKDDFARVLDETRNWAVREQLEKINIIIEKTCRASETLKSGCGWAVGTFLAVYTGMSLASPMVAGFLTGNPENHHLFIPAVVGTSAAVTAARFARTVWRRARAERALTSENKQLINAFTTLAKLPGKRGLEALKAIRDRAFSDNSLKFVQLSYSATVPNLTNQELSTLLGVEAAPVAADEIAPERAEAREAERTSGQIIKDAAAKAVPLDKDGKTTSVVGAGDSEAEKDNMRDIKDKAGTSTRGEGEALENEIRDSESRPAEGRRAK